MTTPNSEDDIDRQRLLSQAVANAVAEGARVELQTADQAIVVNRSSDSFRVMLCLLFWWPGFFFGHHQTDTRQIIRIDDNGATLIDEVGEPAQKPGGNRVMIAIAAFIGVLVLAISIGVCTAGIEDATNVNCRSSLRCDDDGNCSYVLNCD